MPFGYLLQHFRVKKGLSLRQLGRITDVDHAYIDRLENSAKRPPSAEVAQKLVRGLGLRGHEAWLLLFVAKHHEYVNVGMIKYALNHPEITDEEFSWAVAVKYRRPEKLACPRLFGCARQVVGVVDDFLKNGGECGSRTR